MSDMENDINNNNSKKGVSKRDFLKIGAAAATVTALAGCTGSKEMDSFFQKHFKEMSKEDIDKVITRLESEYEEKYGQKFKIGNDLPIDNTLFRYGLDISRCIGCRRCVYACVEENNQSRAPQQIHWIKVLEMDKEKGIDFHHSNAYYDHKEVPHDDHFYLPVACQQCENPACVKACPVEATWKTVDGIVVVDYNWCIGCRFCMAACPYGARHFNWGDPILPKKDDKKDKLNMNTHYLGNRPRYKGVVEKCTFCVQRVRDGKYPACVEICPVGARKFGNVLDPASEIRYILKNKRILILKEELNTQPKFFYFFAT